MAAKVRAAFLLEIPQSTWFSRSAAEIPFATRRLSADP
jgi:hypothetical protein